MLSADTNAFAVAREIDQHGQRAGARAQAVVAHHGLLLQSAVKRHAAEPRYAARGPGTGGPRIITGDYNRSITLRVGILWADVGTDKPQGRRLELGFVGVDALGRVYDQPPYPHFSPGLDEVREPFIAAIAAIPGEGW